MTASTSKASSSTDQIRTLLKKEVEKETKDLSIADTIIFAGQTQASEAKAEDDASGSGSVYDKLLIEVISEVLTEKARRVVCAPEQAYSANTLPGTEDGQEK